MSTYSTTKELEKEAFLSTEVHISTPAKILKTYPCHDLITEMQGIYFK